MTNASTCSLFSRARIIGSAQSVDENGIFTSLSASAIVIVGSPVVGSMLASILRVMELVRSVYVLEKAQIVTPTLSTHSVIIIIATDAVAQFTIGDPVQNADDILPLTSSAILIRLPVGVMFWNASLNAMSRA